jgi:hypothetical protein
MTPASLGQERASESVTNVSLSRPRPWRNADDTRIVRFRTVRCQATVADERPRLGLSLRETGRIRATTAPPVGPAGSLSLRCSLERQRFDWPLALDAHEVIFAPEFDPVEFKGEHRAHGCYRRAIARAIRQVEQRRRTVALQIANFIVAPHPHDPKRCSIYAAQVPGNESNIRTKAYGSAVVHCTQRIRKTRRRGSRCSGAEAHRRALCRARTRYVR